MPGHLDRKIDLVHIQPGKPTQNAYVESFNSRLREECLRINWFQNLFEARRIIAAWRQDYNERRPHSSLNYLTPAEFARKSKPWKRRRLRPLEKRYCRFSLSHRYDCGWLGSIIGVRKMGAGHNRAATGIGQIYFGPSVALNYNWPGWAPNGDPRTPDIIVTPNVGVTYTGSAAKLMEHGGFAHDDTNVMLLLSNPAFRPHIVFSEVGTLQVAPIDS